MHPSDFARLPLDCRVSIPEPPDPSCRCCGAELEGEGAYCETCGATPGGEPVCRCGRVEPGVVELQLVVVPDTRPAATIFARRAA